MSGQATFIVLLMVLKVARRPSMRSKPGRRTAVAPPSCLQKRAMSFIMARAHQRLLNCSNLRELTSPMQMKFERRDWHALEPVAQALLAALPNRARSLEAIGWYLTSLPDRRNAQEMRTVRHDRALCRRQAVVERHKEFDPVVRVLRSTSNELSLRRATL